MSLDVIEMYLYCGKQKMKFIIIIIIIIIITTIIIIIIIIGCHGNCRGVQTFLSGSKIIV